MMLQGMTAQYLLRRTYRVKAGDAILVHAAAGGVGSILCQWGKHLGATVIGTVGTDEKAKLARENGCDHVIVYTREDFAPRVRELTDRALSLDPRIKQFKAEEKAARAAKKGGVAGVSPADLKKKQEEEQKAKEEEAKKAAEEAQKAADDKVSREAAKKAKAA